jgi:hypothetical protein
VFKRLGTGVLLDLEEDFHEDLLGDVVVIGEASQVIAQVAANDGIEDLDERAIGRFIARSDALKEIGGNPIGRFFHPVASAGPVTRGTTEGGFGKLQIEASWATVRRSRAVAQGGGPDSTRKSGSVE